VSRVIKQFLSSIVSRLQSVCIISQLVFGGGCRLLWSTVILVCDPTIQQPGFDLPRHSWTLLNRFRTGQGPCCAKMHKWGLASSPLCDCGEQQTMEHIVDSCPLTKLDGGLLSLHEAEEDAISWLKMTATKALAKRNFHIYSSTCYVLYTVSQKNVTTCPIIT